MAAGTTPVLVAGAGPTGLIAALTLAQINVLVRIIDKEPQHRPGQRGPGIQPRTFELFHIPRIPEIHEVQLFFPRFTSTTKVLSKSSEHLSRHHIRSPCQRFHTIIPNSWINLRANLVRAPRQVWLHRRVGHQTGLVHPR